MESYDIYSSIVYRHYVNANGDSASFRLSTVNFGQSPYDPATDLLVSFIRNTGAMLTFRSYNSRNNAFNDYDFLDFKKYKRYMNDAEPGSFARDLMSMATLIDEPLNKDGTNYRIMQFRFERPEDMTMFNISRRSEDKVRYVGFIPEP